MVNSDQLEKLRDLYIQEYGKQITKEELNELAEFLVRFTKSTLSQN